MTCPFPGLGDGHPVWMRGLQTGFGPTREGYSSHDEFRGYTCPACRDGGSIDIAAAVWVRLPDDGTDATTGDHEYEPNSLAKCGCGYSGELRTFDPSPRPPTLEEALRGALTALNTARCFRVLALGIDSYRIASRCDAALAAVKEG